ncbi:hypothetical protein [Streptomyces sp. NPDC059970]|uniref:hypothetical protein n=1 Tax=Streptomyces sp. NPDC059970 TaxID=3347019 RepID=UPI0036A2B3D6
MIEYRKSGLSLNWIVGCPLECGYCVRHLFDNFEMKVPRRLMSDEEAVTRLVSHPYFRAHKTPIQLLNRATDPMLPIVKPHVLNVLRNLDEQGLTNHVLIITRWRVTPKDCAVLNSFTNLRLTVLVTHSNIADPAIEPVDSRIAAESLRTLYEHAERYRTVLYWRPIVPGLNDSDTDIERARELSQHAHATVFTGLFFREEIASYYESHGLPMPYDETARRKIMPQAAEERILAAFQDSAWGGSVPQDELRCRLRPQRGRLQRPLRRPRAVRHLPQGPDRAMPGGVGQAGSGDSHPGSPSPRRNG